MQCTLHCLSRALPSTSLAIILSRISLPKTAFMILLFTISRNEMKLPDPLDANVNRVRNLRKYKTNNAIYSIPQIPLKEWYLASHHQMLCSSQ